MNKNLKNFNYFEIAMALSTQTTGVRVRMRRTMTPAKYEANTAYRIT